MADTDDGGTFHQDKVKVNLGPKLTYSKLLALLAANKNKTVVTLGPKEYDNITGTIQNQPNTEIDGENASEEGNTLDGPTTDNDHLRRRLYKYKIGEDLETEDDELVEGYHVLEISIGNQKRRMKIRASSPQNAIRSATAHAQQHWGNPNRVTILHSTM